MNSMPSVADVLATLELNTPNIYKRCRAEIIDKNGQLRQQRCIINLTTGDVFKHRPLSFVEQPNFCLVRQSSYNNGCCEHIDLYAYQSAQEIEGSIVLATWVFGDSYNYPNTTKIDWSWYNDYVIPQNKLGEKVDESALFNVKLSTPRVAAAVIITKDKKIFSWENVEEYGMIKPDRNLEVNRFLAPRLLFGINNSSDARRMPGLLEAFKSVFQVGYVGANRYVVFDSHRDIPVFMKAAKLEKKLSARQTRIDELVSIALPDHSIVATCENVICYADKVNNEWTVLRWYHKLMPAQYVETSRMYVNKTEALHCRNNLYGDWVHAGAKIKAETFNANKICLQSDDVFDGTKLEYFKNVSTDLSNQSAALYMLTMYPEFEKLCKAGLGWLCDEYLSSTYQRSWKNYLEEIVGHVDLSAKTIFKMIGLNRHQIDKIAECKKVLDAGLQKESWKAYYVRRLIVKMKTIFGSNSLNDIDDATFDYILDSISNVNLLVGSYVDALVLTFELYHNDAMYFIKDLNAAMKQKDHVTVLTEHGYRAHMSVDRMYLDTLRMIQSGQYTDVIRPRFSSLDELVGHHQIMVDLINADQAKHAARVNAQYNDGFNANHDRWVKLEWDEDDEFCVIAPNAPVDIAVEGITLRHCVKSYIPSIAQGKTNVLFIRRKGNESDPFFTVEVDMSNNIRQVHGMCNCNTESVAGLTEFVKRWAKVKKLKYNQTYANGLRVAE